MKMGFLESVRRGGAEKTSFAVYLVKEKKTIFDAQDNFRCQTSYKLINGPVH